ncbi:MULTISPECIES: monovalent cation/H+ antiporter subunit D [unclassified Mesorhizobium]|uniref:monovalent cation/H+ antiporter subunit D n=1 Tax=unclassified Mesorhizobium TaxID=325217 RepID=UPI000FCCC92A|nr:MULTISPECIES: monovalent cation/H+ antiporter subunit D [unclassified Mesorhizobium]RUY99430.1 monovalent cation/H+ antiporter subunit D [Mesorhizobium sp. M7A.F.Ca.CA.001.12.2.1]RUZ21418.1 monovalent cation/H+ antiporter subunit D [Mesorhizobium sp. M7A.F.Ca.US.007.01.2.1]RUZ49548.1 monovalent cation/H+ antiporter subunit D [Mesorhizobium sp. M7A.F.Ca.US.003.02.1.1]RUZ59125.1 monovalent cation/H+ antiporter subunit D [Mesorhizobium sp. M7A.F.Ca.US.007.01.1.1]
METAGHLMIMPIVLPFAAGAVLLLLDERRHVVKAVISIVSALALVVIAIALLRSVDNAFASSATTGVYLLGNWPAPFGIVLVLDRLSALMLVLTSVLALASLAFSLARWHKAGPHFHTLFQFLLMGLNGAFLTGDLFNLFVFFEVLLAASYGLVLHGSGPLRVKAGLHYIAVNLAASSLFLIGVSLIYGVTGTLNMADLAQRIPAVPAADRMLLEAGAAVLGVAFLVKAGMWPLSFWLPGAYSAAAAPVAAIFVIMTKVGFYILLRLSLLLFGVDAGATAGFGDSWLLFGGMATIAFGAIGVLASQAVGRLAGFSILVSSGTLLAAIGMADARVTAGALFYMVSSTLTIGAFFLLIELVERVQDPAAHVLSVTMEAYRDDMEEPVPEQEEVGVAIPGTLAVLGICFAACGLLLAGLPPLSGFVGKFALLTAMVRPDPVAGGGLIAGSTWVLVALLILSGLCALIATMRAGIQIFWAPIEGTVPRVLLLEIAPVAFLLTLCLLMTVQGGPMMRYMDATAQSLHSPADYLRDVLSTQPIPGPNAPRDK